MYDKVKQAKTYQSTDAYSSTAYADPHALIAKMFDGVLIRTAQARGAIEQGNIGVKAESLSKAVKIISALDACLNPQDGGDIARNLSSLYEYMNLRLAEVNLENDLDKLDEVTGLLLQIKAGWTQISPLNRASA